MISPEFIEFQLFRKTRLISPEGGELNAAVMVFDDANNFSINFHLPVELNRFLRLDEPLKILEKILQIINQTLVESNDSETNVVYPEQLKKLLGFIVNGTSHLHVNGTEVPNSLAKQVVMSNAGAYLV